MPITLGTRRLLGVLSIPGVLVGGAAAAENTQSSAPAWLTIGVAAAGGLAGIAAVWAVGMLVAWIVQGYRGT